MTKWLMLQDEIERLEAYAMERVSQADLDSAVRASEPMKMSRGSVAQIPVKGPILNARSRVLDFFGAQYTTYPDIQAQIGEALAKGARRIDFMVDSPGGAVDGLYAAMDAIRDAPVKTRAIAGPTMASAAYILASQAGEIVAENDASAIGSVGVAFKTRASGEEQIITNSDSPKKSPDVTTEDGKAIAREYLDDLWSVLNPKIAMGRGVSPETVKKDYGQGAIMTARTALQRRMIDAIQTSKPTATPAANQGDKMDSKTLKAEHRATYDEILEIGAKAERERVCAHLVLAEGSGDYDTAHQAIKDGDEMSALVMAKHQSAAMKRDLIQARQADNPLDIGAGATANEDEQMVFKKGLEASVSGLEWEVM